MYSSLPKHLQPKGDSGQVQLDPLFLYADNRTAADLLSDRWWKQPLSEAQRHRLVEGSKSPTELEFGSDALDRMSMAKADWRKKQAAMLEAHNAEVRYLDQLPEPAKFAEVEQGRECTPWDAPGTKVVFERRQWSNEFRVRPEVEAYSQPPEQEGARESIMLSYRGAKKIAESCAYVATEREGFTTFVTLTFDDSARLRTTASGEFCTIADRSQHKPLTIQKEVSRVMDGWQKVYQRGMKADGVPGHKDKLDYIWVVEIPENQYGQPNPHIHVLMRWAVPFEKFRVWAKRLETLWGHGFAHLEKIDDPQAAGAYMAKAAGYITKASGKADQGEVRGNRYGISATARAPDWEKIGESQLHIMGQLIADVYDHLTELHGNDFKERKALNDTREGLLQIGRKEQAEHPEKRYPLSIKNAREKLGEQLAKVRERIKSTPIRAQGKYQVVINGVDNFARFMGWAKSDDKNEAKPHWLPEKPAGAVYMEGKAPNHDQKAYIAALHKTSRVMTRHRRERIWQRDAVDCETSATITDYWQQCKSWAMDLVSWNEYRGMQWT